MLLETCKLSTATIELYEDKVSIIRSKKTIDIPFDTITSIIFSPHSFWLGGGHITFTASGLKRTEYSILRATVYGQQYVEIDEGKVDIFGAKENEKTEVFYKLAKKAWENYKAAHSGLPNDPADAILKYKGLLDQGIISQEEFEQKKKQLLGL